MYGAPTWKRHIGWSSSRTIQCLDLGRLCAKYKALIAKHGVKSTRKYKSKSGKTKFHGSKSLKATGFLVCISGTSHVHVAFHRTSMG